AFKRTAESPAEAGHHVLHGNENCRKPPRRADITSVWRLTRDNCGVNLTSCSAIESGPPLVEHDDRPSPRTVRASARCHVLELCEYVAATADRHPGRRCGRTREGITVDPARRRLVCPDGTLAQFVCEDRQRGSRRHCHRAVRQLRYRTRGREPSGCPGTV